MRNPLSLFPERSRSKMSEIEKRMDRWMRGAFNWPTDFDASDFSPSCEIEEKNGSYLLQFDVPGVKKEDIKIEVENNRITVSGERKHEKEEKDSKHYFCETSYGSFMRSVSLSSEVDESKVDARYENGVLKITVPKKEATKSKEVKIN